MSEEVVTIAVALLDEGAAKAMQATMKDSDPDSHSGKAAVRLADWPKVDGMITLPTEVLRPHAARLLQNAAKVEQTYFVQKSIPRLQAL